MKLASIVLKAALDYASSADALEMAGFTVTDWSLSSEKRIEVELENIETHEKKRVYFRIFQGHPGPNHRLFWSAYLEKFIVVPEVGA